MARHQAAWTSAAWPECLVLPIVFAVANQTTQGTAQAECIIRISGKDIIFGGGGDDRIHLLGGADTANGDPENDIVFGGECARWRAANQTSTWPTVTMSEPDWVPASSVCVTFVSNPVSVIVRALTMTADDGGWFRLLGIDPLQEKPMGRIMLNSGDE